VKSSCNQFDIYLIREIMEARRYPITIAGLGRAMRHPGK
jgi:uncharacterized protein with von Willebrand factor type A (vWA) domain